MVLKLKSPGGTVTGYGLAAAELLRLRQHQVPLVAPWAARTGCGMARLSFWGTPKMRGSEKRRGLSSTPIKGVPTKKDTPKCVCVCVSLLEGALVVYEKSKCKRQLLFSKRGNSRILLKNHGGASNKRKPPLKLDSTNPYLFPKGPEGGQSFSGDAWLSAYQRFGE